MSADRIAKLEAVVAGPLEQVARPTAEVAALREAMVELAYQVVAQSRAPSVRRRARAERSPFGGLYDAVLAMQSDPSSPAFEALRGRIKQCFLLLDAERAQLAACGADLNTGRAGGVGVAAIGLVNVVVSFLLALWLALRARRGMRPSTSALALVRIGMLGSRRRRSSPRRRA